MSKVQVKFPNTQEVWTQVNDLLTEGDYVESETTDSFIVEFESETSRDTIIGDLDGLVEFEELT